MKVIVELFIFICLSSFALAESKIADIKIIGKYQAKVSANQIYLNDIATIKYDLVTSAELANIISKIRVTESPKPGASKEITGTEIVQKLEGAGIDLSSVRYTLPQSLNVTRNYQELSSNQISDAIMEALKLAGINATTVSLQTQAFFPKIPEGETSIKAIPEIHKSGNQHRFQITVASNDGEISFPVTAKVEDWRDIPVAAKVLERGEIVDSSDIMMARMDINTIAQDVLVEEKELIGLAANQRISNGDTFRKAQLKQIPTINKGSKVIILYSNGLVQATASAFALQAGQKGETIQVKNEISNKVIEAEVVEPGLVRIRQ